MAHLRQAYLRVMAPHGRVYAWACTNARVTIYKTKRPRQIQKIRHGSVLAVAIGSQKAGCLAHFDSKDEARMVQATWEEEPNFPVCKYPIDG